MDIQIITYDSYQTAPTSLDKSLVTINGNTTPKLSNLTINHVPILRIYGKIKTNHTCLLHIHNVFPYLYIPFPAANSWKSSSNLNDSQKLELIKWLIEINSAMSQSYKRKNSSKRRKKNSPYNNDNDNDNDNNNNNDNYNNDGFVDNSDDDSDDDLNTNPSNSYISDLSIVTGIPFYGYHLNYSTFLKISLISPKYISRLSRLLSESKIFSKFIQPYESHVPYTLQFLMDYNCYTLKEINMKNYLWRNPLLLLNDSSYNNDNFQPFFQSNFSHFNSSKFNSDLKKFVNNHIHNFNDRLNILDSETFPRISRSMVELDIISSWITNRNTLDERMISKLTNNDDDNNSANIQYITSTKSLLDDVQNLRKNRGLPIGNSTLGLFDHKERKNIPIQWNEQDELDSIFNKLKKLSQSTYLKKYKNDDSFEYLQKQQSKSPFPTSFQSIEILQYSPNFKDAVLMNTDFIDKNSENILDTLLSFSKSFNSTISSIGIDNQYFPISHDNFDMHSDIQDEDNILQNEEIDDLMNPNDVTCDSEESQPNNSINDLTAKLQDATTLDDSAIFDNSDLKFLESTQQNIPKTVPIQQITLSQREKLANEESFTNYFTDFDDSEMIHTFNIQQPVAKSSDDFLNSLQLDYNMLKIEYLDPYFSKLSNFDSKPFIFAGEKFQLKCSEVDSDLYPHGEQISLFNKNPNDSFIWKYTPKMPSFEEVNDWVISTNDATTNNCDDPPSFIFHSQIKGPTQKYKGFKYASLKTPPERIANSSMSQILLIIEIHINTRNDKMPDPERDEITAIFWNTNIENLAVESELSNSGVLVNSKLTKQFENISNDLERTIICYDNEYDMLIGLVSLVEYLDPDILVGFELHSLSWGYIIERTRIKYTIDLVQRFSRVVYKHNNKVGDRWGYTHASGIKMTGRQLLNLWRRLRSELNLNHYSLENIVFHIFHNRLPNFTWKQLTEWWETSNGKYQSYVLNYHLTRIDYEMGLIKKLEMVEKINEQSRLLGIDFYSMIYRGSQFKVECLLVRLAKAENLMLISPSKKQVFKQDSLECIPLVMEPNSAFYKSPLVVLDFQSLYPSLIIAYNLCYSTMLGKLKNYDPIKYTKMGVTNYKSPEGLLKLLENDINITPNGIMFAKQNIRKSLLAKMLVEILNARIYIKNTMNEFKDDYELQKLYNNRQLALKLIANVTYGYTSASYSGRMPNSDIADAIVSCGRETLLKAVKEIESNSEWGAKVVYGDTDSLFIYLPGKTKDDAFKIGREMADHITSLNPEPVKLKFEKVYLPSILVSKKRYIGWSYEYESQKNPKFDAKGIETVRRDGIPAQQKILEKAITLLFETRDISQIKEFIMEQFVKIVKNKINIQDFLFAKEVRIGTYKNEKYIPPGARLSMKKIEKDHRLEPQYKERVFYIVRKGHNKEILRDRCVSPDDFMNDSGMELDSDYYINKVLIPPLERIFNLVGVDVRSWVKEIPQVLSYGGIGVTLLNVKVAKCISCGKNTNLNLKNKTSKLCDDCQRAELHTMLTLKSRLKEMERKATKYMEFCKLCTASTLGEQVNSNMAHACCNEDCNIYYSRVKTIRKTDKIVQEYQSIPDW